MTDNVAVLVDQLFAAVPGGVGTYLRMLVPALHEADPELRIALFHARSEGHVPPEGWTRRYWVEELPAGIRSLYPRWALTGRPPLPATLGGTDVLHAPSPVAVPPAGDGQRLVVTVHDLAFVVEPDAFPPRWRALYRAGLRRAVKTADALIAVSERTADDLRRVAGVAAERIRVIPLAPSLPITDTAVEVPLGRYRIRAPYVLFNGTLEPRKNLIRLIRAYRDVAVRGAPHTLVLAGPLGWKPRELLDELIAPAPGRIVLTGHVPANDLDALYRGADAFVYPSLYEGFGLPVLDAMARGIPCVVSDSSSLPEVTGGAARSVDARSIESIADGLHEVLTDDALSSSLRQAGTENAARFSWERTAKETLDVYEGGA